MTRYFINFFVWWYLIEARRLFLYVIGKLVFILESTKTISMAQNLRVPMFQDTSSIGKNLSLILRALWVWFGGLFSVIMSLPFFLLFITFLLIPIVSLVEIILILIKLL